MKEKFKCQFCEKDFTTDQGRNKHEKDFCLSNENSKRSIKNKESEELIKKAEEEILIDDFITDSSNNVDIILNDWNDVEEEKYTDNEKWLINFFSDKSLSNIRLDANEKLLFKSVYQNIYNNKPLNVNCQFQVVSAFTSLWYWLELQLKNKK